MKTQKPTFWLLATAMIFTFLLNSCTKETISEIEQTEINLSAEDSPNVETLLNYFNEDVINEMIDKRKRLNEKVTKEKVLKQSLLASIDGTIYVPDDFPTIQKAVNAAAEGSLIIVDGAKGGIIDGIAGSFYGCAIENKNDLTIRGINNATVFAINNKYDVEDSFYVGFSNGITIENFTLRGGSEGVWAWYCHNTRIVKNKFYESLRGVLVFTSDNTEIVENSFYGIELEHLLDDNGEIIREIIDAGILMGGNLYGTGGGGTISNNEFFKNVEIGISLGYDSEILIEKNSIESNFAGITANHILGCRFEDNTIKNAEAVGAIFFSSHYNFIEGLEVSNSGSSDYDHSSAGIYLSSARNNKFIDLEIKENFYGLSLDETSGFGNSTDNYFIGLETKDNSQIGIYLDDSSEFNTISSSESKSNGVCDFLDEGINNVIIDTEIGSTCN